MSSIMVSAKGIPSGLDHAGKILERLVTTFLSGEYEKYRGWVFADMSSDRAGCPMYH